MGNDKPEPKGQPKLKLVIDDAKPVKKRDSGEPPNTPPKKNPIRYLVYEGKICKPSAELPKPLCNFSAWIMEEVLHDNGDETEAFFVIDGKLATGQALPQVEITAASFAGMAWVTSKWGAAANVYAGQANKDGVRDALQELSHNIKRRTVYTHTGWRCFNGVWRYLHGGGAIGKNGNVEGIEVNPGQGHMGLYRLPPPPTGEDLTKAIKASVGLLGIAPEKPELGAFLLAAIFRAPTAEAAPIDHSGWLFGSTGNFKSEAAALALAHFGEFDGRHIPANFTDSEGSIERKTHATKDALIVVDDFKPVGGANDVNKLHSKADRIFRGVGNQAGRGTLTVNRKERAALHARGFVLATGEDLPRGQSLRARLTVIDLAKGDIDRAKLTALQQMARDGLFRQTMAAYLQWLAPQMDLWKKGLPDMLRKNRDKAISLGFASAHSRTASDYASLRLGLTLFAEFITEAGALSPHEIRYFEERGEKALMTLAARQADNQGEECEVRRFFALIQSALSAGRCHVSDRFNHGAPANNPHFWGWRSIPMPNLGDVPKDEDGNQEQMRKPQGQRIGWSDGDTLFLEGEAAYAVAQSYTREQGATIEISKHTLWKRVFEKGLLTETSTEKTEHGTKRRLAIKRRFGGPLTPVYSLSTYVFENDLIS